MKGTRFITLARAAHVRLVPNVPLVRRVSGSARFVALLVLAAGLGLTTPARAQQKPAATDGLDRRVLPIPEPRRAPLTELDVRKATAPPRFEVKPPKGAPNVVIVLSLSVNGTKVAEGRIVQTNASMFSMDEGADVGVDEDTPVTEAYVAGMKSRFTGKIVKVTVDVK